jgi:hypothetical protein
MAAERDLLRSRRKHTVWLTAARGSFDAAKLRVAKSGIYTTSWVHVILVFSESGRFAQECS